MIARFQRSMSRTFAHVWAPCCDMLGVVGSNLTIFEVEPPEQNFAHNNVAICCDRWAGA